MTSEANGKLFSRIVTIAVIVGLLGVCIGLLSQGGGIAFAEAGIR